MDSSVAESLGWKPSTTINAGVRETHSWLLEKINNA